MMNTAQTPSNQVFHLTLTLITCLKNHQVLCENVSCKKYILQIVCFYYKVQITFVTFLKKFLNTIAKTNSSYLCFYLVIKHPKKK